MALRAQGRLDEAIAHYHGALALRPDEARLHANLAAALHPAGRFEEAIASLQRLLQIEPQHADAHRNLGWQLLALGRFREGWTEYRWRAGGDAHDLSGAQHDLERLLALLDLLDDYVGVSSTAVHLRAGLGRSARVLVPMPPEWRWMTAGAVSPWFPSSRVYRQGVDGSWREALEALARELCA